MQVWHTVALRQETVVFNSCSHRAGPKFQAKTPWRLQTALDRGDIDAAVGTVLSLARRGYAGAGRAAAVLAAGGHLEGRDPGLAGELLATALAHCPAGELPSLLDRWAAVDRYGGVMSSAFTEDEDNTGSASNVTLGGSRVTAAGRPGPGWLARRLRACFAGAGFGAARGLALLPQLADAHLALAAVAAMGLQPGMAALESKFGDGLGLGVPARAVLLFGMYATGIRALESTFDLPESDGSAAVRAIASEARQRLQLLPWAVLRHVRQLPNELHTDQDAARAACLAFERYSVYPAALLALAHLIPAPCAAVTHRNFYISTLTMNNICQVLRAPRRRLVLTADRRCIQQWLPSKPADDLTDSSTERRQALLEQAADAIAAYILAGKRGGSEALEQLLGLSARCVPVLSYAES